MKRFVFPFLLMIFCCCFAAQSLAQQGTTISLKGSKPPENANHTLRAEKTDYGKLSPVKKFLQNTYTHFNYLFNAEQIFNQIMKDAIASNTDDYSQLISFYPYNENALKTNAQFDSVIQHATTGLLLHDLRNDYVDELYYILGKSYYCKQISDTAQQIFRYMNYAFAPKDEGYDIPIGSNISNAKDKNFSIASKEAGGLKKNNLKNINRRNDALLWLAKTLIQQKDFTQANILLNNIGRDAHFPERLQPLYFETKAYFFYRQNMYDSAATYLAQCSFSDDTKFLKTRRAFLAAQLFQHAGEDSAAVQLYNVALQESNNPVIDIYAQKNIILLQNKFNKQQAAQNELSNLLGKNKYYQYKDLIYYNQAEIAKANNENETAKNLLMQSISTNRNSLNKNPQTKSSAYLLLGNIAYEQNKFYYASRDYDSVSETYIKDSAAQKEFANRRAPLKDISANIDSIRIQDSLLALANMPEKQRTEILKEKAKQIRKAIDRREENDENIPVNGFVKQNTQPVDLFNQSGSAATWYFNNPEARSAGYQLFKQKFGNRPNVDNWQRLSAITKGTIVQNNNNATAALPGFNADGSLQIDSANITAEDLLQSLPMTQEKKDKALKSIMQRMLQNGEIMMNKAENFSGAITLFDSLIYQYPKADEIPNALYDEYVCYTLLDKNREAENIRQKLLNNYTESAYAKLIKNTENTQQHISPSSIANSATKEYSDIYDLFISGKFEEALKRKSIADKHYGNFYWTPQLLYIEAAYFANKRNDSAAINDLNTIINRFSNSTMVPQAKYLINILTHRKEIEEYLSKLHIKPEDYTDENMLAMLENGAQRMSSEEKRIYMKQDSIVKFNTPSVTKENQDINTVNRQMNIAGEEDTAQTVVQNNAAENTEESYIDSLINAQPKRNADTAVAINIPQKNNPISIDTIKNINPTVRVKNLQDINKDTIQQTIPKKRTDTLSEAINNKITKTDTTAGNSSLRKQFLDDNSNNHPTRTINGFTFDDAAPVYVTVVLDNVAQVFASEGTNAFNRYNLFSFPNESYSVNTQKIDDKNLVIIGPFKNMQAAKTYQSKVQPQAAEQIIPWITKEKYFFLKISPQNLQKIRTKEDLEKYKSAAANAGVQ